VTAINTLIESIFDGRPPQFQPEFYAEFEGWLRASRRFRAFAEGYQTKIRSKLKNVRDEDAMKALRVELETALLLLGEERFALEYEKYAALKQRGPDYAVTFRTRTPFNVEVRRVRSVELDDDSQARTGKLMSVLCDKVGQMPPGIINLLWLTAEREITEADINSAAVTVRQLAERKDEAFFTRRGFASATDFLRQYRQLSGIVLHQAARNVVWLNSLAKHKTPPEIVTAIQRLG
jgi:hypothetical protein